MVIVVTGFGLFRDYNVNASWEAVRGLKDVWTDTKHELITEEIPVEYDFVLNNVPHKWSDVKPDFIVHVGVSCKANMLTLEKQGHNTGYDKPDVKNCLPPEFCCDNTCSKTVETSCLDLEKLNTDVNNDCGDQGLGVESCVSDDAGHYLCDFVYFKSLNSHDRRSLFVHVPEIDKPYSVHQMTLGLKIILENIVKQLDQDTSTTDSITQSPRQVSTWASYK